MRERFADTAPLGVDDVLRMAPVLVSLDQQGCNEAPVVLRELLLAAAPRLLDADTRVLQAAFGTLASIHRAEVLRLAAHPLANDRTAGAAPALPERIAEEAGVPMHPHTDLLAAVTGRLTNGTAGNGADDVRHAAECCAARQSGRPGHAGPCGHRRRGGCIWLPCSGCSLTPHLDAAHSVGALRAVA